MTETNPALPTHSPLKTEIRFDISDELTPEEISQFQLNAAAAGAHDLTEYFLDLTLRISPPKVA